ncbi:MAG: type II toxin-antitoxin system HigB family toxin [Bacteroidota bacterium]
MRIISRRRLREFWEEHANAESSLKSWYQVTLSADWESFVDVKETFGSADYYNPDDGRSVVIFNIGGNNYRLVAGINYETKIVYVKEIMTHATYDKDNWKGRL